MILAALANITDVADVLRIQILQKCTCCVGSGGGEAVAAAVLFGVRVCASSIGACVLFVSVAPADQLLSADR